MRKIASWALVCFVTAALAGAWRIEMVDEADIGDTSIALDSTDCPHIAYLDGNECPNVLRYARRDPGQWHIELVDDQYDCTGYANSIALNSLDRPCISYGYTTYTEGVRYAEWNGSQWKIRGLSHGFSHNDTSLALDSLDRPHVAFSNVNLNYGYWDGASWQLQWFDDSYCDYVSIALDSYDRPHIAYHYFDGPSDSLIYTYWNGSTWIVYTLDNWHGQGYCEVVSIALDSTDTIHIAYHKDEKLYYIYDFGDPEVVDNQGYVGREANLALDSLGRPHICYFDADNDTVKYAHWDGSEWLVETVAQTDGNWYGYASIALDSLDLPHISYSGINDYLMYARYDPNGFHLLEPEKGEVVETTTPLLNWEDSPVPDHESYTLWWGADPDFNDYNEVAGIGESEYQITEGIEDGDRIWWRVKSIDDEEEEYWAEEMDWYFDVDLGGGVDIVDFSANAEDEGILVDWRIEGDSPSGLRVLRSVGDAEPVAIHHNPLPGSATSYLDRKDKGFQPLAGMEYRYWLEVTDNDGLVIRFGPTEAVTVPEYIPELILYAAYPNPSRETINFVFSLPDEGRVELSVYDLSGRRIASLVDSNMSAGRHEVSWSCGAVSTGVYLCRLETDAGSITQRLVIAR